MSSRPPPPPSLYPRDAPVTSTAPERSAPLIAARPPGRPRPMATTQATPAPFALPAHPFLTQPLRGPPRLPPPLQLGPRQPLPGPLRQRASPSLASSGPERPPLAPGESASPDQPYTPPISDPSYSPYYSQTRHEPAELAPRAPRPTLEHQTWPMDPRVQYPTYPSPGYAELQGATGSYGPAPPALGGLDLFPPSAASLRGPEAPPTGGSDEYEIHVRQQPLAARACGFGERDRRVIDPPPIVQLTLRRPSPAGTDPAKLQYPFHVMHCTLWNEEGTADETAIPSQDRRVTRRLMGTLVASPFVGTDENDQRGCFFCFPDLSCRTHGRYRLRFVLMRIEMGNVRPGGFTPILTSTMSNVFVVYTAKNFPGMRPSTALTKALKLQGCAISVKKGNEKVHAHARDAESDDDDNTAETQAPDKSKRQRKT